MLQYHLVSMEIKSRLENLGSYPDFWLPDIYQPLRWEFPGKIRVLCIAIANPMQVKIIANILNENIIFWNPCIQKILTSQIDVKIFQLLFEPIGMNYFARE
jgi:hypothetical protein